MARLPAALTVVTPAGRSILLLTVASYLVDTFGGWPVFQLIWVSCLMMLLVAVVLAVLPVRAVVELGVAPRRTVAGEGARVLVEARSASRLPVPGPLLDVPVGAREHLIRLPMLRPGHPVHRGIELDGLRRGVVPVGPATARRTDPLGLLRWTERWSGAIELLVLPRMVRVESLGGGAISDQEGTPSDEISMSDLAFHALREYVPGDDLRHVHWRSSAKASKLFVRQYHDTRRSHLTVVIDDHRDSYRDPEDFETAVSAAASIAARADRDGVELSLLCGTHAVSGRGLDGVLDACCRIQPGDTDPAMAAREALRLAPDTSWLVMLTGGQVSEQLAGRLRAGLPPEVSLLLVTADATEATLVTGPEAMRLMTLRTLDELPRAISALARTVQL